MIHVANTSMAGCGVMCVVTGYARVLGNIVGLMSCGAAVFGDVVRVMTRGAGVSAWTIIARRATVFRHATMIVATIMSAGRGSSRVTMAGVVIVAGRATTMAAVGTVIATRVASRCAATTGTAVPSAVPASGTVAAAAVATAAIAATTTAIPATTTAVAAATTTTTTAMVSHGTLDMPCMRSGIEPPRGRGHRQSTRADRQDEQQRSPTSVGH
jgi:hypothetical protein